MPAVSTINIFRVSTPNSPNPTSDDGKTDEVLWGEFKSGNESAFVQIYSSYYEEMYNYGFQVSGDLGLVQDCIQDLFMEIRKNRMRLGATNNIRFYLFKALRRKIIREKSKWFRKFEAFSGENPQWIAPSHEQHLIDQQVGQEAMERLQTAIQELTPKKREVLYYFYFENLTYEQIRELMGVSNVKSIRNLLYETISLLRKNW
ncbi:RNA polymerase sigma factor [Lunatibacter salilacus]|uniref:RNA polymerase sigma factor n=1 Tax=Lunatibacter salilacus TaxID=2483804 RepID=UPI00131C766A|nr:sigma-70 family RNA polymerase sigma factor [Lunatibacter salilacus]